MGVYPFGETDADFGETNDHFGETDPDFGEMTLPCVESTSKNRGMIAKFKGKVHLEAGIEPFDVEIIPKSSKE